MGDKSETILSVDIEVPNQTRYLRLIGNIAEQIARGSGCRQWRLRHPGLPPKLGSNGGSGQRNRTWIAGRSK